MKDKKTLLMIIDILNEYTDSDHILTCNELINKVKDIINEAKYWVVKEITTQCVELLLT